MGAMSWTASSQPQRVSGTYAVERLSAPLDFARRDDSAWRGWAAVSSGLTLPR